MPATMAEQVRRLADAEGVSMNTFLVAVIARGLAEHPLAAGGSDDVREGNA
jgi:hypothetical protein